MNVFDVQTSLKNMRDGRKSSGSCGGRHSEESMEKSKYNVFLYQQMNEW
jgi:hypothetical protein